MISAIDMSSPYFAVDSSRVTRVTEKITPRILVHPPDIAKRIL
jgi:hypothetical protein